MVDKIIPVKACLLQRVLIQKLVHVLVLGGVSVPGKCNRCVCVRDGHVEKEKLMDGSGLQVEPLKVNRWVLTMPHYKNYALGWLKVT